MKKLLILCLLLISFGKTNSQTFNSAIINLNDGKNTTVLTNEIDSITYSKLNTQDIWTKDSLFSIPLSSINSTTFEKFELPDVLVKSENIGDWSEMRIATDGSFMMIKEAGGKEYPEDLVMILPSEDLGVLYSCAKIDEEGMPKYITINDCIIFVDAYYNNYVDLTIAYNDTISYSIDSLSFNNLNSREYAPRRSWSENNWQRNLAGIVELASGAAGVVGGALLVTGSVVSEAGSFGTSTPISIPGILAGSATIGGGVSTFRSGWNKLFTPGENRSNVGESIYYQGASELIANGPQNAYIPDLYWSYMKDPNYSQQLGRAGWINFFVSLTAGVFDNIFGYTVTWEDIRNFYQGKVLTGLNKDVTTNSAIVRGYISPSITRSLRDGLKVENEYGIVLYSATDEKERYIQKETNGDGGMIEYSYNSLKPGTCYNYATYYADKTNGISLLGGTKTFTTLVPKVEITDFKVIHSQYSDNEFVNDGINYSYKYHCSTSVRLNVDGEVDDWGYIYRDPQGKDTTISLKSFGSSYTDTRYAYYRNSSTSTVTLFGYIKYKDNNETYYEEPQTFDLKYEYTPTCPDDNHPHWIDMGLPSGRKWKCCNEGASSPEEFGEYYTERFATYKYQYQELIDNCSHVWDGKGYLFIGPNGGRIYMPAAGYYYGTQYQDYVQWAGEAPIRPAGRYWLGDTNSIGSHYYFGFYPPESGHGMGFGLYGRSHNAQGHMSIRKCQ